MNKYKNNIKKNSNGGKEGDALRYMETPCTISETVQISRAVAEDVVTEYQSRTGALHVSVSLQVEILKDIVIRAGLITEEEFRERYIKEAEAFNAAQSQAMKYNDTDDEEVSEKSPEENNVTPITSAKIASVVNDIEVKKE